MKTQGFIRAQGRRNDLPSSAPFEHLLLASTHAHSAFNTGFREWLRKITSPHNDANQLAREQVRLEAMKKLVGELLGVHLPGMSPRDKRLYLRILSTSQLASFREVRFECFDLMCRKISEPVAVRKLQELDSLIA